MVIIKKKASSHIEMIMSFVLFIGFTFFLIYILKPTEKNLIEESILFGIKDKFFEYVSINMTTVLVNNSLVDGECNPCRPNEIGSNTKYSTSIVDENNRCLFYVYASSEFSESLNNCSDYGIGNIKNNIYVSNKTLLETKKEYIENYSKLREELGIPSLYDFSIIVVNTEEFDMEKTIPDDTQVVSRIFRNKILYSNGSTISYDFIIKVW